MPRLDSNKHDSIYIGDAYFVKALQRVNLGESARLFLWLYAGAFLEFAIRARMPKELMFAAVMLVNHYILGIAKRVFWLIHLLLPLLFNQPLCW